jgi:hypothetical protein
VNREDSILDAKTLARARIDGQVGGVSDMEETFISLTAEVALYREIESMVLLRGDEPVENLDQSLRAFR